MAPQFQRRHGGGRSPAPGKEIPKTPQAVTTADPKIEEQTTSGRPISVNTTPVGHSILDHGEAGTAR